MFDGKQPNWHHVKCFFEKQRPHDVTDFSHFEQLRWEDQETIRKKIGIVYLFAFFYCWTMEEGYKSNHFHTYRLKGLNAICCIPVMASMGLEVIIHA